MGQFEKVPGLAENRLEGLPSLRSSVVFGIEGVSGVSLTDSHVRVLNRKVSVNARKSFRYATVQYRDLCSPANTPRHLPRIGPLPKAAIRSRDSQVPSLNNGLAAYIPADLFKRPHLCVKSAPTHNRFDEGPVC